MLVATAVLLFAGKRDDRATKAIAAYVLAVDESSRLGGWFARPLNPVSVITEGETVKVPQGAKVRVLFPDGRTEDIEGAQTLAPTAPARRGEVIDRLLAATSEEIARIEFSDTKTVVGDVRLVSPAGVTRFTNPEIVWITRPGAEYELAIIDPTDPYAPPRVADHARPPLKFQELQGPPQRRPLMRDRLYEVHVRERGSTLMYGFARLLVSHEAAEGELPEAPMDLLCEAAQALAKRPVRAGDAWLALSRLPEAWANTEPALRLRMHVAIELGLEEEFVRAKNALAAAQR